MEIETGGGEDGIDAVAVLAREVVALARSLGIDTDRVRLRTFMIGAGLAALAGVLLTPLASVDPNMGVAWLIGAFMLVMVADASYLALAVACLVFGGHGQQFKARFLKTSTPSSIEGIEKYRGSGMIRGIGSVYAKKMVKAFGEKVFDRHRHIKFAWSMPNGGSWSKVMLKGLRLSRCSKGSTLRFVHDAFLLWTVDPGDDETGWRSDRGWREISEHAALI